VNDELLYRELTGIRTELATLAGAVTALSEHVDQQNGRIGRNERRIDTIEDARIAEAAAAAAREEVVAAVDASRQESRKTRFAWIAAAGTVGGLITGLAALVGSAFGFGT
jgi:chromosome segregation ATPase